MGRLRNIPSRVAPLPPRIARGTDAEGHSATAEPWRKWYHWKIWKDPVAGLRMTTLIRDNFTCQIVACGKYERDLSQLVADHKVPHRGDWDLFKDPKNLWTLCKPCHDRVKQAEERAGRGAGMAVGARIEAPGSMSRPAWFRKVHVPLTVVCGPPGAGKSTYVRARARPGDRVICFDELARRRFGAKDGVRARVGLTPDQIADVLRERNELIADLMRPAARGRWSGAWLILVEPVASHRQWWVDQLGARVVVLATPAEICRARIVADDLAGDRRGAAVADAIEAWWAAYTPAACDCRPESED